MQCAVAATSVAAAAAECFPMQRWCSWVIANSQLGTVADKGNPTVQLKHSLESHSYSRRLPELGKISLH